MNIFRLICGSLLFCALVSCATTDPQPVQNAPVGAYQPVKQSPQQSAARTIAPLGY